MRKFYLIINIPILILYGIVIFIIYPSNREIIKGAGTSLPYYSVWALHICDYMYSSIYILFVLIIILCNFFILNSKYKVLLLNFLIWFLVYLLFSISVPLAAFSQPSSVGYSY